MPLADLEHGADVVNVMGGDGRLLRIAEVLGQAGEDSQDTGPGAKGGAGVIDAAAAGVHESSGNHHADAQQRSTIPSSKVTLLRIAREGASGCSP